MPAVRAFASHDWGVGSDNHARVARVVEGLRARGIDVWFDDTHMRGNVLDAMCRGIDTADVVVVFVTRNYLAKVERGDESDNVRREFMYAKDRPHKLVAVRFDAGLPRKWSGPVGMVLGSHLYIDLTEVSEKRLDELARAVRHRTPHTLWKCAVHKVRKAAISAQALPRRRAAPVRDRVSRAYEVLGDELDADEHVGRAVDRLVRTLSGSLALEGRALHEKLLLVERELGI